MSDNSKEPNNDPEAMDDSDEEDEDYIPGVDPNEPDEDENDVATGGANDATPLILSITKQKAVDDAFFDLFGYHYTPTTNNNGKSHDKIPTKSKRTMSKQRTILSSIFGYHSSMKIMLHAKSTAALARPKPSSGGMLRLEKRVITEVKRFAGQEIKVEKVVMVPVMADEAKTTAKPAADTVSTESSTTTTTTTTNTGKAKGVDNLLSELSRPEKLSTISKTSADWDLFKAKNTDASLKEQLENQASGKEAYLVKKDFLSRVDNRQFELEKKERDSARAKRGK
mmetsp:Transcript_8292/g.15015  ORF Transcript_8292/g.15015 Transcript_8292/m.15015 type:complete len:282 (-) Transcript_8292:291-1136(-)